MLALSTGACTKWPPYESELVRKFNTSRDSFETLEAKIVASEYFRVSQTGILGIPRLKDSYEVVAEKDSGEIFQTDVLEDDPEWEEHFRKAGLFSVEYYDSAARFGFSSELPVRNRSVWAEFVHAGDAREGLFPCLAEHRKLECGACVVDLDKDWFIYYWWTPADPVPGGFDRVLDEEITEDEYWVIFNENLEQCRLDGYSAIGYDTSGWFEDEG